VGHVCLSGCIGWCHSWMVTFPSTGFFFLCLLFVWTWFFLSMSRHCIPDIVLFTSFFFAAFLRLQTLVLDFPRLLESLYDICDFSSPTFALRTLLLEPDLPSTLDGFPSYRIRTHLLAYYSRSLTAIRSFLYPKVCVLRAPVLYIIPNLRVCDNGRRIHV